MLKGEVLPHLVRQQFIKSLQKKEDKEVPHPAVSGVHLNTAYQGKPTTTYFGKNRPRLNKFLDIGSFHNDLEEKERIKNYSSWNDHRGHLRGPFQDHNIRCYAFVAKEGFCQRANTLNNYCELNRQVFKMKLL